MRWDALFADLAAQQDALEASERATEAAERGRIEAGADWVLLDDGGREVVVRCEAIVSVTGLSRFNAAPGLVDARLGLRHVLRAMARERAGVQVALADGSVVVGTIDRVGVDHIDVAVHAPGEARRRGEVRESAAVPVRAICAVRRDR